VCLRKPLRRRRLLYASPAPAELVLCTDDVDAAFISLLAAGAAALASRHDFLDGLRAAWFADPLQIVTRAGRRP
jgi:hypothetical protein